MLSLGIGVRRLVRRPHWSKLAVQFAEWRRGVQFRYDVERLSERDLADMGLTRLDAVYEMQKPFWKA